MKAPCGVHKFHKVCLEPWIGVRNAEGSCPCCRGTPRQIDIHDTRQFANCNDVGTLIARIAENYRARADAFTAEAEQNAGARV